jgi:hypothetical protein
LGGVRVEDNVVTADQPISLFNLGAWLQLSNAPECSDKLLSNTLQSLMVWKAKFKVLG